MRKFLAVISGSSLLLTSSLALAQPASNAMTWLTQERWDKMLDSSAIEIPKLLTTLIFLGLGWVIGKRLTVLWSRHQKENEQDLDAARDFHALYGDFFALWKLWNYYVREIWDQRRYLGRLAGNSSIELAGARRSWSRR